MCILYIFIFEVERIRLHFKATDVGQFKGLYMKTKIYKYLVITLTFVQVGFMGVVNINLKKDHQFMDINYTSLLLYLSAGLRLTVDCYVYFILLRALRFVTPLAKDSP